MFKDVGGVWGVGSCLQKKRVRIVLPACLAGLFPCIVLCVLFLLIFLLKLKFLKGTLTGMYFVIICIMLAYTLIVCTVFNV